MGFADYWYIVAASDELRRDHALARGVLGERIVCFRERDGRAVALRDRCLHRNAPLSAGTVRNGILVCGYHGWSYDGEGHVVAIPSMPAPLPQRHCQPPYPLLECDGYVYVRLAREASAHIEPFAMPHWRERGWKNLRLVNRFRNTVSNCVENFIDIPHTAFVHRGIFRSTRGERIEATVTREGGRVSIDYRNERGNLGRYRWFLNPRGLRLEHSDHFHAPNITSVIYRIGRKEFMITSQSVPMADAETLVYTDLTYRFGWTNRLAAPFVRRQGQRIIDQDMHILALQQANIERYGAEFRDTPADVIHRLVDSIRDAIGRGEDPQALPRVSREIEFLV